MADEITISAQVRLVKGNDSRTFSVASTQLDQTGVGSTAPQVEIGTSEEDVTFPDIANPSVLAMRNLDPTNFVRWGPKSGGAMIPLGEMRPGGEPVILRLDQTSPPTLRMVADTAPCRVEFLVLEE